MARKVQIALVEGDGSGPEMMAQATEIAHAAALIDEIEFVPTPMGWNAYDKYGDTMPEESLRKATEIGLLFFGGVGDPKFDATVGTEKPEMMPEPRCLLGIRQIWGLLINLRPVTFFPSLHGLARVNLDELPENGITQHWMRYLLEDSYFGNSDLGRNMPSHITGMLGIKLKNCVTGEEVLVSDIAYYRKTTIEEYLRYVFEYAKKIRLPIISIDKANVMARYVFWRKVVIAFHKANYPEVPLQQHLYVDAANALLFEPAKLNGVIICGNEHGDILSDGAAASVGSLGLMCSSAVNPKTGTAMFESGAGTAPTLAGQNKANPIGRILTAAIMLRHIGAVKGAKAIEWAVLETLKSGYRTQDLVRRASGKKTAISTSQMGQVILSNISPDPPY